ncbi:hypothetical protein WH47_11046, partial [Habropoda laboriosa]
NLHRTINYLYLQAISATVKTNNGAINFPAVYNPTKFKIMKLRYKDILNSLGSKSPARGDYTAKHVFWGLKIIIPRGRTREHFLNVISKEEPTLGILATCQ